MNTELPQKSFWFGMASTAMFLMSIIHAPQVLAFGGGRNQPELETVAHVDLNRYIGLWYEVVRLPQRFEKDCTGVTASYALRDDGKISVENRCRKFSLDGEEKIARGKAKIEDTTTQAKLKVSFFWPFWGDYWILELGENYEYAVVGAPDRESLWILSRTPKMDERLIQEILSRRALQGFDVTKIERTIQ